MSSEADAREDGKVVSLAAAREQREQPDQEFRGRDDFGRPLNTYVLSYDLGDATWSTRLTAYSMEDAQARVEAMRATLRLDGQVFSELPA